jgi:protein disulfide-isomerase A1
VFVAHLSPDDQHLRERFEVLAERYRDRYSFGLAAVPHPPAGVGCFNNVDNKQHSTTELESVESLTNFIKLCSTPLIPQLTRRNEVSLLKVCRALLQARHWSDC